MLGVVRSPPPNGCWVLETHQLSNLRINDRNSTKSTVMAVSLDQLVPDESCRHSWHGPRRQRQSGRISGHHEFVVPPPPFAPRNVGKVPNNRVICAFKELLSFLEVAREMRLGSFMEQSGDREDFFDGLEEALYGQFRAPSVAI